MYCLFFVPTIDKSYQGSFEGGVQQLASDKMVEMLVQASNGQYPNKTSQSFLLRHAYYFP